MKRYKPLKESIPKAPAYWISPIGKILPIYDDDRHIDQIIKNPKAFGLTIECIQKIYDDENETLGIEGKARERIIKELILKGWIRIRRYMRQDMFSVNISRLTKRTKNYLYKWAKAMEDLGLKHSQVKLDLPNKVVSYSVSDITKDVLFNESIEDDKYELEVVDSVEEL